MCGDSWLTQQSVNSLLFLLSSRIQAHILYSPGVREGRWPKVFQNDVGGKKAQHWNVTSVGRKDTAAQLWTIQQRTRLLADQTQPLVPGPPGKPYWSHLSSPSSTWTPFHVFHFSPETYKYLHVSPPLKSRFVSSGERENYLRNKTS